MTALVQHILGLETVKSKFRQFFNKHYLTNDMDIKVFSRMNENIQAIVILDWLNSVNININCYKLYFDVYFLEGDKVPEFDKNMGLAMELIVLHDGDYYMYRKHPYNGSILDGYKEAIKLTTKMIQDVKLI